MNPIGRDGNQPELVSLSQFQAQSTLDTAWKLTETLLAPDFSTNSSQDRRGIMTSCQRLCFEHDIYPRPLLLVGVKCTDRGIYDGGGLTDVHRGVHHQAPVALKRMRVHTMTTDAQKVKLRKEFNRESLPWKILQHDHILPFLGISSDVFEHSICIVVPWMENGNARRYIASLQQQGALSEDLFIERVNKWLYQVSLGLEYLHENGIVHGGLHGGNILIDSSEDVRLTDFGMVSISEANPFEYASPHHGGASHWRAPELIVPEEFGLESAQPIAASDVYAFACTCIELYTGGPPFGSLSGDRVIFRVVQGKRPDRPINMLDNMWGLVTSCWVQTYSERPSSGRVAGMFNDILSPSDPSTSRSMEGPQQMEHSTQGEPDHDVLPSAPVSPDEIRHPKKWHWRDWKVMAAIWDSITSLWSQDISK